MTVENLLSPGRHPGIEVSVETGLAQCLTFGDTPHDVTGAHAAGLECVGVASGHFTIQQLREAGTDYAIGSLEESLPL